MPPPLRLLKIDSAHPLSYLDARQRAERTSLEGMSYDEYYAWLMGLRLGLSDYLTAPMNEAGWVAREFIPQDGWLRRKSSESGQVSSQTVFQHFQSMPRYAGDLRLRQLFSGKLSSRWRDYQKHDFVRRYIESFRPNIIFIREPSHMDGRFFAQFRDRCIIAAFIGCNTNHPINWNPFRSDIIFTLTDEYHVFFRVQGIPTERFVYGVDERVAREVENLPKVHDSTFVGYLGTPHQRAKTELLDAVAGAAAFKWWGVKGPELASYPNLERSWQGETAGIDMYRIYRQSKIVLNDYVEMNNGKNVNMRSKEVMNVGSMLLTRRAANVQGLEREGALATFGDAEECVAKIRHYLTHEAEREAIATAGLRVALRDFNYRDIAANLMRVLEAKVIERGKTWAS
jgi:hypothetical protein